METTDDRLLKAGKLVGKKVKRVRIAHNRHTDLDDEVIDDEIEEVNLIIEFDDGTVISLDNTQYYPSVDIEYNTTIEEYKKGRYFHEDVVKIYDKEISVGNYIHHRKR